MRGYARTKNGLEIIDLWTEDDEVYRGQEKLAPTGEEVDLRGWPDEGIFPVYRNEGGIEIIVPIRWANRRRR